MAYDRFDPRDRSRDERSRWSDDRFSDRNRATGGDWHERDRNNPDDRGFFDRASDEVASWFGDEEAERRRREDHGAERGPRDWNDNRRGFVRGGSSAEALRIDGDRNRFRERGRDYRPFAGDPGRADSRSDSPWARDDRFDRSRGEDPHYRTLRDRHLSELDRDYDEYRRERQSMFESDFGGWRERRQAKRGLLGQVREHMDVVGKDDEHVGTVDKVAGDRIILTKSDPESGGAHHSLSCSDVDRIEGDRVILDCSAGDARRRWRDESRSRALFEREDQGEMGPRMLDRSFEGTYR